jgi:hypothetical protein
MALVASVAMFSVLLTPAHAAEGYSGGELPPNGVLTQSGSPYVITRPIVVLEGETLSIEPGVSIIANPEPVAGVMFLIDLRGSLVISGRKESPVRIVALGSGVKLFDTYYKKSALSQTVQISFANFENLTVGFSSVGEFTLTDSNIYKASSLNFSPNSIYKNGSYQNTSNVNLSRNAIHGTCPFMGTGGASFTVTNNYFLSSGCSIQIWPGNQEPGAPFSFTFAGNTFARKNLKAPILTLRGGGGHRDQKSVNVAGNFWGTTSREGVLGSIYDGLDQRGYDLASFEPWLDSASLETPKKTQRERLEVRSLSKFKNCAALNKVFPAGISQTSTYPKNALSFSKIPFGFSAGYQKNKALDRDKDRVACEK